MKKKDIISSKDLIKHIEKLKLTFRQREFVKAAFRALIKCELEERMGCKVDI